MGGELEECRGGEAGLSRVLLVGTAGVVLIVCGLALWLGRLEWFFRDDFVFLARMQDPDSWTWSEVFLPLERRPWIFYRPLSMELFFYGGYGLFGLDALPYYGFSLALDFATAPFVYCIAIQLGFERRAAIAGALLAVTRAPTLTELYYASCFMYVAVLFFGLASGAAFLRYLRAGGARWQLLSCLALVLAFGCNEVSVLLPALFALLGLGAGLAGGRGRVFAPAALGRLARALVPQALLTALFVFFRFVLVGPVESDFWNQLVATTIYRHQLGPHVLPNVAWLLEQTAGGALALAGVGLLLLGTWSVLASSAKGREQLRWLVGSSAILSAWILLLLPVFALLPQREARWAMMLAFPLSLLVAAHASALLRAHGSGRDRLVDVALLVLLLLALPVAPMLARAADPVGGPPRRFVAWAAQQRPRLAPDAILVALYGGPGLASEAEAIRLRASTSWGRSLAVAEPGTRRSLRFHDVSQRPARGVVRPDSIYVRLLPGLRFERASAAWLERELPRHPPDLSPARTLR